jgi:hypothetical protein
MQRWKSLTGSRIDYSELARSQFSVINQGDPMAYQSKQMKHGMWMAEFDVAVCNRYPALSGRIDWNTANHFFHVGMTPQGAADKYLLNPDRLPENAVRLVRF